MKTRLLFLLLMLVGMALPRGEAQLANGTIAPDFTLTDLDGNTWNLYTILNSGKTVYLEFSATWCGPCWNYHNGNHLKNLYNQYGPSGTDEVFVMFIEGDLNTNTACLYGPSGCTGGTQGDWVTGTPFPIVDLNSNTIGVRYDYAIAYWPTIYAICPQTKKVYLAGQRSTSGQYEYVSSCGMTYGLDGVGDASCNGVNDGFVHISPNGGYAPYSYTWSNGFSGQNLNNVGAGTYDCVIKDKNLIEVGTASYTVTQPDAITLLADGITTETCPGYEDGAVDISVGGGAGGFSFSWSNGDSAEDLTGVSGGTYTLVVTDATGCTKQESYTVPVNPLPVANAGNDGVLTCTENLFTIDGTQSENFGVSYLWTTTNGNILSGANTPTPVVDQAGEYVLTVAFFSTGCFATDEAVVAEDKESPTTQAGEDKMLSCAVQQVSLNGLASQQGNGFTYLWTTNDGNIVSGASTLTPIVDAAGTYTLVVTNQGTGCTGSDNATVTVDPNSIAPVGNYDYQATNLIVQFNNQSSGNPASYLWTFGDGNSSNEANPSHIYTEEGEYEVCLTVTNACGSDTQCSTLTVNAGSIAIAVIQVTPSTCNNGSNGAIDIQVSGGTPDYQFLWSNGATTEDLAEVPPGSYSVTVTDDNNEATVLQVTVGSTYTVLIDEALTSDPACYGDANGVIALNTTSTGGDLTYLWSHDQELDNSLATNLPSGTYTILVTDPNGCTDEMAVVLTEPEVLEGNLEVVNAEQGQNNGSATITPQGGTAPYSAAWSNGATTLTVKDLAPGEYEVVLTDANGCTWTETFRVEESVSIGSIPSLEHWTLQPNPARGQVTLEMSFAKMETASIRIFNFLGSEVFHLERSGLRIQEILPLHQLVPGQYLLEVRTRDGRALQQLIVH